MTAFKIAVRFFFLVGLLALLLVQPAQPWTHGAPTCSSNATINVAYGSHIGNAPADFQTTTVPAVVAFYERLICLPITISLNIDWGFVNGGMMASGDLGSNRPIGYTGGTVSYSSLLSALQANAISARAQQAVGTLPMSDPLSGFGSAGYCLTQAQSKALGLTSGTALDGYIGIQNVGAQSGDLGDNVAHEISEVLGRNFTFCSVSVFPPLDLYRYSGSATRAVSNTVNTYFSINSGSTDLNDFNGNTLGGDTFDWRETMAADAFDVTQTNGPVSTTDMTLIDVLGYNTNVSTTWP